MKIDVSHDHSHLRFPRRETISTIKSVLRSEKKTIAGISVIYTNSPRIRAINEKHLKHNYVTDVIAFELEKNPVLETEIYINLDRAKSQAKTYGETFRDETRRLLIHGLLHVLGYDDKSERQMVCMRHKENAILNDLRTRKT